MAEENKHLHPDDVSLVFNSISDRTTYGVETPDGTGMMAMISGYDLKIAFDLSRINSLEDAEAAANALADVFYQNLMDQLISENKSLVGAGKQH